MSVLIEVSMAVLVVLLVGIPFVTFLDKAKKEMEAEDADKGGEADVQDR